MYDVSDVIVSVKCDSCLPVVFRVYDSDGNEYLDSQVHIILPYFFNWIELLMLILSYWLWFL